MSRRIFFCLANMELPKEMNKLPEECSNNAPDPLAQHAQRVTMTCKSGPLKQGMHRLRCKESVAWFREQTPAHGFISRSGNAACDAVAVGHKQQHAPPYLNQA